MHQHFKRMLSAMIGVAILAAMLPTTTLAAQQWLEANQASLRYELSGNGKSTVVLLHEIGMSLEGWDEIMPAISKGRQVLRYDQRGFGQSEKIRGPFTMADEVEDLRGLLDGLQIEGPVTLIGGAIGATIALKFAVKYPERVRGLVLLSPIFNPPTAAGAAPTAISRAATPTLMPTAPAGNAPRNMDTATLIETQGVRVYLEQQLDNLYPASLRTQPQRLARFYGIQLASDPTSRATVVRMAGQSGDVSADLSKVQCPSLVVATSMFGLRPAATVKAIADAMPKATFIDLPTGHLAALESPELVGPMLVKFLSEVGG